MINTLILKHYRVLLLVVPIFFFPSHPIGSEAMTQEAIVNRSSSLCEMVESSEFAYLASDYCIVEDPEGIM
jgi:hypothetical protein